MAVSLLLETDAQEDTKAQLIFATVSINRDWLGIMGFHFDRLEVEIRISENL